MGKRVRKPFEWVTGTKAASGDNTLIAAPGSGERICVDRIRIQNESATASTAIVKHGSTAVERFLGQSQGDAISHHYGVEGAEALAENTALVLNLSDAVSWGYSVRYWVEKA